MSQQDSGHVYRVGTLTYTTRTLATLFFWLLWGDVCYMMMESVVPSILPLKFEALGVSNTTIGLLMVTIPSAITAILNPIISVKSDRYRCRWGRRIPFIIYTLPLLVMSLIGLGYADGIGVWLVAHSDGLVHMSAREVAIASIGFFIVAFTCFNSFVGAVFWYLFNDVVPEHLLARFMSLFRLVSMMSTSIYNFFIFQYAGQHAGEIMLGVALLYFFGFGAMCLNVKEGQYKPPPNYVDGSTGVISAVKTFGKECMTLPHYWLIFLVGIFNALLLSVNAFGIYFSQSIGLNLTQIGRLNGSVNIAVGLMIPISGWLADRFHPVRIVIAGFLLNACLALPFSMIWLFWHPGSNMAFWISMLMSLVLAAPANALIGVLDPPLFMMIFPRSRYGQYCSANAMLRAVAYLVGGGLSGAFFDLMDHFMRHKDVYRMIPVWQLLFSIPILVCLVLLYRSWQRYGGDAHYIPPVPGESLDERLAEESHEV
jgi:MFS family permease